MIRKWTNLELAKAVELRLRGDSWAEVCASLGRTESSLWVQLHNRSIRLRANGSDEAAVRNNLIALHAEMLKAAAAESAAEANGTEDLGEGVPLPVNNPKTLADTTIEEDVEESKRRLIMSEAKESKKKYEQILAEKAVEDRLLDIFRERLGPFAPPPPTATSSTFYPVPVMGRKAEAAVLLFGDTHVGACISPAATNNFGAYSPRLYCERLHYVQTKVIDLLSEMPPGFDEVHIVMLGDILHGALSHHAEREDTLAIADQFQLAIWTIYQFIATLSLRIPAIHIHTCTGNHGRWPGQKRMPTTYRYSNLDYLVYASLQMALQAGGLSNVHMRLNTAHRQVIEIKGSRFLATHGDHLRGGDRQFGIPIHSATRDVNATVQRYAAAEDKPIDYFLCGDKHRSITLPLARGEFIINGSMVGVDEFAMNFAPGEAMQLVFGVDSVMRKTWSYSVKMAHAPALPSCPYALPEHIRYLVEDDTQKRAA